MLHLTERSVEERRSTSVATTFDHAAFNCTSREAMESRLQALGVKYEVGNVPLTGQVQLFLTDPAGNGVELNFANAVA